MVSTIEERNSLIEPAKSDSQSDGKDKKFYLRTFKLKFT